MELLIVNHRDPFHPKAGGAEHDLYETAKRLAKMGVSVTWLSEEVSGRPKEEELDGIRLMRRGNELTLHLYAPLEARRHEIVMDSIAHAVPFFSFLTNDCAFAKIHHVHQLVLDYELPWYLSKPVKFAEKFSRFYKKVVVPSHATMEEAVRLLKVRRERVTVIPEAVDLEKFRPGEKSPEPFVLWLHRMKKYKNPLMAIQAFDLAREKGLSKEVKLVMVGGGDLEPLVREEARRRDYVVYLGRVSEEEKVRLLRQAWVFLSTSFIEGFGLSVLEASASGTPTIAFAVGSLRELIKEGVNGWLVGYGDVEAMAGKLVQAFSDYSALKKMWESSRNEAEKYSWDRTARMYYDFLKSFDC
jgi:glycosyltransferase involved in cell wall biosynthesis